MNRKLFALAASLLLATGSAAIAQTAPTTTTTAPPAVTLNPGLSRTTAAPVAGANSFTENQAREHLVKHGFSDVSALTKDAQSIWRGKATRNGARVDVAVDYQGNVVAN